MKITHIADATAQRPAFVAPTLGGVACEQAGFRRVDAPSVGLVPAAGMATGCRTWSPPIT
jgi:hypothetical protein